LNVKHIYLSGQEVKVIFPKRYPAFWVQNLDNHDVYISVSPDIQPYADGVYCLPAGIGNAELIEEQNGKLIDTFYILGD